MQIMMHLGDSFEELAAIDRNTGERIYDTKQVQRAFGNKIVKALNEVLESDDTIKFNQKKIMFDVAFSESSTHSYKSKETE
jgi:hypothetical protein